MIARLCIIVSIPWFVLTIPEHILELLPDVFTANKQKIKNWIKFLSYLWYCHGKPKHLHLICVYRYFGRTFGSLAFLL